MVAFGYFSEIKHRLPGRDPTVSEWESIVSITAQRESILSYTIESGIASVNDDAKRLFEARGLNFDYGKERNQFSDVDSQLCLLDLWGWRPGVADPVGSFHLEGAVKRCGKGDRS